MFGNNNLFCFIDFATKRGKSLSITAWDTKYQLISQMRHKLIFLSCLCQTQDNNESWGLGAGHRGRYIRGSGDKGDHDTNGAPPDVYNFNCYLSKMETDTDSTQQFYSLSLENKIMLKHQRRQSDFFIFKTLSDARIFGYVCH